MKKTLLALSGVLLLTTFIIQTPVFTSSSQPPAARTGAPFDGSCSSVGCHNGPAGTEMPGEISITMDGSELDSAFTYTPGQTYTVSFSSLVNTARYGFELVAVDSNNANAGTITLTNTNNTSSANFQNRTYVGHKSASSNDTWSFSWIAPSNDIGPVTFFYSLNAANNNGMATGDNIIQGSRSFNAEQTSTGIWDFSSELEAKVYPNPVTGDFFHIETAQNDQATARLFDLSGNMVSNWEMQGLIHIMELPVGVSSGVYLLNISSKGAYRTIRLSVQ